jgi:hypothetical protein
MDIPSDLNPAVDDLRVASAERPLQRETTDWVLANRRSVVVTDNEPLVRPFASAADRGRQSRRAGFGAGAAVLAGLALAACGGGTDQSGIPTSGPSTTDVSTPETPVDTTVATDASTPTTLPDSSVPPSTDAPVTTTPEFDEAKWTAEALDAVDRWSEIGNRAITSAPVVGADGVRRNPTVAEFASVLSGTALSGFTQEYEKAAAGGVVPRYFWTPTDERVVLAQSDNRVVTVVVQACSLLKTARGVFTDPNGDGVRNTGEWTDVNGDGIGEPSEFSDLNGDYVVDFGEFVSAGSIAVVPTALLAVEGADGQLRIDQFLTTSGRFACEASNEIDGSPSATVVDIPANQQKETAGFDPRL